MSRNRTPSVYTGFNTSFHMGAAVGLTGITAVLTAATGSSSSSKRWRGYDPAEPRPAN